MEGKGIRLPDEGHFVALAGDTKQSTVMLSFKPPSSVVPLVIDGVKRKELRLVISADDAETLATGMLLATAEARIAQEDSDGNENKE